MRHPHMNYLIILPVLVHEAHHLFFLKSRANRAEGFANLIQLLTLLQPQRRRRNLDLPSKASNFSLNRIDGEGAVVVGRDNQIVMMTSESTPAT
jgi:hypothetical protein